jgi:hypothetical protein
MNIVLDLRASLSKGIDSLGGKPRSGIHEGFKVFCAIHINRVADGFLALKGDGRIYAARMLIRPAMEAMFKLLAVKKEPSLLFRIACYEHEQDEKWARPFAPDEGQEHNAAFQTKWDSFKRAYKESFPDHVLCESSIDLRALAAKAGVGSYYDSHYRLYCQYTHAALNASTDDLEEFAMEDERVIGAALIVATEAVLECGGESDSFHSLRDSFFNNSSEQDGGGQPATRPESK